MTKRSPDATPATDRPALEIDEAVEIAARVIASERVGEPEWSAIPSSEDLYLARLICHRLLDR